MPVIKFLSEREFNSWYNRNKHNVDIVDADKDLLGGGIKVKYLGRGSSVKCKPKKKHIVVEMKKYRGD